MAVREADTVARFGGEEFVVLVHGAREQTAATGHGCWPAGATRAPA